MHISHWKFDIDARGLDFIVFHFMGYYPIAQWGSVYLEPRDIVAMQFEMHYPAARAAFMRLQDSRSA